MALIQAFFYSNSIQKQVGLYAIVPEGKKGPFPVYYLLHGLSDDYTIWQRRTRIEWYVRDLPLIVVMPDGYRGFYTDNAQGPAYGLYMVDDLIDFVDRTFPSSGKRSGRCIGGLSMGGYGALRMALAYPDLFISANSHSGVAFPWEDPSPERKLIFGAKPHGSAHDLMSLAAKLKKNRKPAPQLLIDCGTEDFLLKQNREMHARFDKMKLDHEYHEYPGTHEWDYWDLHVREALEFHCRALKIK